MLRCGSKFYFETNGIIPLYKIQDFHKSESLLCAAVDFTLHLPNLDQPDSLPWRILLAL